MTDPHARANADKPRPHRRRTPSGAVLNGDANCDGKVDPTPSGAVLNGDANCDGFVNALDALYVLVFKVQLHTLPSPPQSCFPIGSVIT